MAPSIGSVPFPNCMKLSSPIFYLLLATTFLAGGLLYPSCPIYLFFYLFILLASQDWEFTSNFLKFIFYWGEWGVRSEIVHEFICVCLLGHTHLLIALHFRICMLKQVHVAESFILENSKYFKLFLCVK